MCKKGFLIKMDHNFFLSYINNEIIQLFNNNLYIFIYLLYTNYDTIKLQSESFLKWGNLMVNEERVISKNLQLFLESYWKIRCNILTMKSVCKRKKCMVNKLIYVCGILFVATFLRSKA